MSVSNKKSDFWFNLFLYTLMILISIITIYPFLNVLAISFNDSADSIKGGIHILPRVFTTRNYTQFFNNDSLIIGLKNSVMKTVIGTAIGVFCQATLAYGLSRKDFMAKKLYGILFIITMYVSGGLIPFYLLIVKLGLINNFWVYIAPGIISFFNVLIIRSFIDGLPYSLQESAMIDGANDFIIFVKIIFPLCIPVLATVTLFIAVGQWNNFFDTFLYCSSDPKLTTLQYELQKILQSASQIPVNSADAQRMAATSLVTPESTRMAMTVIATVPILIVYPFVQKYFVKGMTLGAVKS